MGATMPVTDKGRRSKVKSRTHHNRRGGRTSQIHHSSRAIQLPEVRPNRYVRQIHRSYQTRIRELQVDGAADDIALNAASEKDFWHFINSLSAAPKGSLVMLDNGNLRALWKGKTPNQVGLQFLGGGMAEYVIFRRRPEMEKISRAAGIDTLNGVKRQINAFA